MKRTVGILSLFLSLVLLAGCGGRDRPAEGTATAWEPAAPEGAVVRCRIVDGAEAGTLLLAENGGSVGAVYRLGVNQLELDFTPKNGQLINVYFEAVLETYPAQFSGVSAVELTKEPADDRCGLYLQVLENLWNVDPALNTGITELGVDLSGVTDLTESERSAVAWRFGELHGLEPIQGTFEELAEAGYIDREHLHWENGCLFSITGTAEAFDAEKWRSGTGAYFFMDCAGARGSGGAWTYSVGSQAIS